MQLETPGAHHALPPHIFLLPFISFQFPVSKPSVRLLIIFQICILRNNVKQLLAFPFFCPTFDLIEKMKSHGNFICVLEEKQLWTWAVRVGQVTVELLHYCQSTLSWPAF